MPWNEIKNLIESDEYFAEISIASSPRDFRRRVSRAANYARLTTLLGNHPESIADALQYAADVAHSTTGPTRHHNEVALCTVLIALAEIRPNCFDALLQYLASSNIRALKTPRDIASLAAGAVVAERARLAPALGYSVPLGNAPALSPRASLGLPQSRWASEESLWSPAGGNYSSAAHFGGALDAFLRSSASAAEHAVAGGSGTNQNGTLLELLGIQQTNRSGRASALGAN
jgi:hypothetical protein